MGMQEYQDKMRQRQFRLECKVLGVTVGDTTVSTKHGGGPLAGAKARLETSGDIERRITATRLVLTGPFALAFRKKKDHRTFWLTIEGDGFETFVEVSPKREDIARRWMATFNTLAMNTPE